MIRKAYKPDGTPDLRRWLVECDACTATHTLHDTTDWVIPGNELMPDFCPFCVGIIAAHHISTALRCPGCDGDDLDFSETVPAVICMTCRSFTYGDDQPGFTGGWFITPPPF
ncbi:hypothetical protein [Actinoallomurus rhizosphaericola]|uniref:hypothetical protein n=1 Tax=Actinoallomurus rhizosphaericola TaxID=2952536 RepID=UPI002091365F|nr:hypothetical protein [Actinoallomurus rhizosphaericola]MCO5992671.1 hypothetical protein [Actinoallomurus rhizosphaericola]